ncbi:hypothetical protein CAQUA_08385 [Corynebacterium aquatimens]|uniref:Uncharacterized protein n=1 Tax=Corynebacterium aquatimens TaxID=1190508 RepID=A0A931DZQ1_9CORY|nr:hypothetical protein [Corynebacterium aquatimens]WJY66371.1 hypothetical protein CAQUA_08385 [Corynebacterium aquatimens]
MARQIFRPNQQHTGHVSASPRNAGDRVTDAFTARQRITEPVQAQKASQFELHNRH